MARSASCGVRRVGGVDALALASQLKLVPRDQQTIGPRAILAAMTMNDSYTHDRVERTHGLFERSVWVVAV